jgi:hypothetical protein
MSLPAVEVDSLESRLSVMLLRLKELETRETVRSGSKERLEREIEAARKAETEVKERMAEVMAGAAETREKLSDEVRLRNLVTSMKRETEVCELYAGGV